jgi:hypothetical protein
MEPSMERLHSEFEGLLRATKWQICGGTAALVHVVGIARHR